jgi:hypothetical protein
MDIKKQIEYWINSSDDDLEQPGSEDILTQTKDLFQWLKAKL